MNRFYLGVLLVLLSAAGFGVMPILAIYAYQGGATVTTMLFVRFITATVLFFLYVWLKTRTVKVSRRNLTGLFLLGAVGYTVQSTLYFTSVQYVSLSLAALLLYVFPVIVAALSFFFEKEKLSKPTLGSIALSMLGLVWVLGASFQGVNSFGILLALGAALVYALYIFFGNRLVQNLSPVLTSAYISLFSALSLLTVGAWSGQLDFAIDASAYAATFGITIFSTIIGMAFLFAGMKLIGSTKASALSMIEPVITILLSALLFAERMSLSQLLGGLLVLGGALLVVLTQRKTTA